MFELSRPLPRLPRSLRLALLGALTALLLTLALSVLPALTMHTFAATRAPLTCFTNPDAAHCQHFDPQAEGCTADTTTLSVPILAADGTPLGRLERRHSPHCHTWWG